LMRLWVKLFGLSEFALRLPSVFSGLVNVALLYQKGFYVTFYYADHALPIVRLDKQSQIAILDEALCQGGRIWFLHRDRLASSHAFVRAGHFDPYVSEETGIGRWLTDHASQIEQEWFLSGLYLALLEPGGCGGGALQDGGGCP